jgi:hypothetical protein
MKLEHGIIAYAICSVITFGVSFNFDYEHPRSELDSGSNTARAFVSAMVWPMYISYALTKGLRK